MGFIFMLLVEVFPNNTNKCFYMFLLICVSNTLLVI